MTRRALVPCLLAIGTSLALAAGCDPVDQDADGEDAVFLRPGSGGVWLNTSAIGTHAFAALDLKKGKHDGVRLDRVLVKQGVKFITVDNVRAVDGQIQATQGGVSFFGQQLVGSKWELTLVSGATETPAMMWISSATNNQGAWQYTFQHHDAQGNVASLCDPDLNGAATAVPIADITVNAATGDLLARNNTLYLACTSGAIGKAVTWGYMPWDITVPEFEAAVRVVRADYCGDGQSWTTPGNPLQIQDVWGVSSFANATATNEAVWGLNGALCLNLARDAGQGPVTCGGVAVATCAANVSLSSVPGALMWTKNAAK
jgi:hypothetical protein